MIVLGLAITQILKGVGACRKSAADMAASAALSPAVNDATDDHATDCANN